MQYILKDGKIQLSGDKSLAEEIENNGYSSINALSGDEADE